MVYSVFFGERNITYPLFATHVKKVKTQPIYVRKSQLHVHLVFREKPRHWLKVFWVGVVHIQTSGTNLTKCAH